MVNTTDWNASQAWTAGAIVSTAEDMALYMEALASGALFTDLDSLDQMTVLRDTDAIKGGLMTGYGLGLGALPLRAARAWGHGDETLEFTSYGSLCRNVTRIWFT